MVGERIERRTQNAERRTKNVRDFQRSTFRVLRSALSAALAAAAFLLSFEAHAANQLTAQPRKVTVDDTVQITLVLENSFAEIDNVQVPVRNLRIVGIPSTSTQFEWINGKTSRRKVLTYAATPLAVGGALVGPLVLRDEGGRQAVLPAVTIDVVSSATSSGSAAAVDEQMQETGKGRLFLLASADNTRVFAGDQVVVTWYLYTALPVRDFGITKAPASPDFWIEELTVNGIQPQTVSVNGHGYKRFAVRRAALFPLRSGKVEIGALEGVAEVVEPIVDVFGQSIFEGRVDNARRRSQALSIEVDPLPDGPRPDAVGEYSMTCSNPNVPASGPVALNVTVSGRGNLRASAAPRFASPIDADVDVQEAGVKVDRAADAAVMTRSWRILLFPRQTGALPVPPLVFDEFNPASGMRQRLTCGGARLDVKAASRAGHAPRPASSRSAPSSSAFSFDSLLPYAAGAAGLAAVVAIVFLVRKRKPHDREALRRILGAGDAREKRRILFELVSDRGIDPNGLMNERTEIGDRFRAIVSWIDSAQRETLTGEAAPAELAQRVRDFLVELARR